MNLFRRAKTEPVRPRYAPEEYEPVLRCSICTGEQVACMRSRETGQLREILLIRSEKDLDEFCRSYGVEREAIRKIY